MLGFALGTGGGRRIFLSDAYMYLFGFMERCRDIKRYMQTFNYLGSYVKSSCSFYVRLAWVQSIG